MSKFFVSLDSFQISNTRSWHLDTDYATLNAQVSGQAAPPPLTFFVGNVNNGYHSAVDPKTPYNRLIQGPFEVGPNDTLMFNYVILNSGNQNGNAVINALGQAAGAVLNATVGGGFWGQVTSGLLKIFDLVDCDGIVVADQIAFSGTNLDNLTAVNGTYSETRHYPGTDSSIGCGSNSSYNATFSIQKVPE